MHPLSKQLGVVPVPSHTRCVPCLPQITLFAKHEDGVVVVKFETTGSAATCIDIMNGRFFAGRKLECSFWDGTDYTHRESKDEEKERAERFSEWLEQGSSSSEEEEEEKPEGDNTGGVKPAREPVAVVAAATSSDDTSGVTESAVHAGRVMPDSDQEEDSEEDEEVEKDAPASEEVHAGRVMPELDDLDDDDDE